MEGFLVSVRQLYLDHHTECADVVEPGQLVVGEGHPNWDPGPNRVPMCAGDDWTIFAGIRTGCGGRDLAGTSHRSVDQKSGAPEPTSTESPIASVRFRMKPTFR